MRLRNEVGLNTSNNDEVQHITCNWSGEPLEAIEQIVRPNGRMTSPNVWLGGLCRMLARRDWKTNWLRNNCAKVIACWILSLHFDLAIIHFQWTYLKLNEFSTRLLFATSIWRMRAYKPNETCVVKILGIFYIIGNNSCKFRHVFSFMAFRMSFMAVYSVNLPTAQGKQISR